MDNEPPLTRRTRHAQEVRGYIAVRGKSEQDARDVVARDLLLKRASRLQEKYKNLALIDSMTGLYNNLWLMGDEKARPPIKSNLEALFGLAQRNGDKLCVLMVDLDNFKRYNDTFGHSKGDEGLKKLAEIIRQTIRESDFAARFGGEEIFILLPETDLDGGLILAERIRQTVKQDQSFLVPTTISIGIASYPFNGIFTSKNLFEAADVAVYKSKELGKDRVTVWTEAMGLIKKNSAK